MKVLVGLLEEITRQAMFAIHLNESKRASDFTFKSNRKYQKFWFCFLMSCLISTLLPCVLMHNLPVLYMREVPREISDIKCE